MQHLLFEILEFLVFEEVKILKEIECLDKDYENLIWKVCLMEEGTYFEKDNYLMLRIFLVLDEEVNLEFYYYHLINLKILSLLILIFYRLMF